MKKLLTQYDLVILAAGDIPNNNITINLLLNAKNLVVCDGAANSFNKLIENIKLNFNTKGSCLPQLKAIVGDGDSIEESIKNQYTHIFHRFKQQDDNDLTKATTFALKNLSLPINPNVCYLGATGKREDHTLANIALLLYYYKHLKIKPVMVSDFGWFTPANGANTFLSFPHQQVSIFQIGCSILESKGLKWKLYPFDELWQGTLNEALGNEFYINGNSYYVVYQTHKPKTSASKDL